MQRPTGNLLPVIISALSACLIALAQAAVAVSGQRSIAIWQTSMQMELAPKAGATSCAISEHPVLAAHVSCYVDHRRLDIASENPSWGSSNCRLNGWCAEEQGL
jgi:hypothetical protein